MPVWTRFTACEAQSEAGRAIGDNRDFMAIWMPPGTSEGVVGIRLSRLEDVAKAIVEQLIEREKRP